MGLFQNSVKVKIGFKRHKVTTPCLGASMMWEAKYGKSTSEMKTLEEQMYFTYSLLVSCNDNFNSSFEEFVEKMNKNAKPVNDIWEFLLKKNKES